MRKVALFIVATALMAGSIAQVAIAAEQVRKPDEAKTITDDPHTRGAYDQINVPSFAAPLTPEEERNKEDFGFSGRSPSRPGGEDPNLNPPS
jgi:hypothetical protein